MTDSQSDTINRTDSNDSKYTYPQGCTIQAYKIQIYEYAHVSAHKDKHKLKTSANTKGCQYIHIHTCMRACVHNTGIMYIHTIMLAAFSGNSTGL